MMNTTTMFTANEKENFALHGLIKRKNFLPVEKLANARKLIFQHLAQHGIWHDGGWSLDPYTEGADLVDGMALLKPLWRHPTIMALASDEAPAAASALVDQRPILSMDGHPTLLFTLPNATSWTLPHKNWHVDMPRLPDAGVPGVQIFAFLDRVETSGGGTLAVTGSHRLLNEGLSVNSGDLRKKLMRESYFADLMSNKTDDKTDDKTDNRLHFLQQVSHVDDVQLQVVEMVGEPGDVYFMDLRVLHTVAPNARSVPRLMLTRRYLLEPAHIAFNGKYGG